ncbi:MULTISPECIES: DUF2786 domain-containing protein [Streptomyces]|uniref:DUF2786 domain-containing protein n=1 Tax=Streptomyces echinoruber TaxID=68898 RepID=A0A918VQR9_9ACTN|nr:MULTISPECIES: DUF2786 domain-containing protein [Streptomyces]GHA14865.1 hypothetical protein GCM10010389_62000 [Streptomyces echinoruber]
MTNAKEHPKLAQIRALLAKAEATNYPEEAEALTAKAAELMAKYGIEQALLDDGRAGGDAPIDRKITIANPWAMERVMLINRIALAMGCELIHLGRIGNGPSRLVHVFGFESDVQRVELLYTSLLLQMHSSLAAQRVPVGERARAWRRSWLLGYISRVGDRIEDAERRARQEASGQVTATGRSAALVLADRKAVVTRRYRAAYPRTRKARATTFTGTGYGAGWAAGGRADIGGHRIGRTAAAALIS